ncbi:efflux RND transporter periplasmic adaptor subunit [Geobacter argillaceus]|uniref:Cobalt-zinc-cadmium efflux system membrane fusion protein n=1 Tax=Geobacter argillaceus TaxID=345631 RepID=A0A562VM76_9BACT|nr:efflux RND transporter periplasmic adaptor subunit [Geobacter argillaceus]TWJ18837.1 cobalt-zinc-cadmium efflux system membrane fusion protein [Geobacter argillaceus]
MNKQAPCTRIPTHYVTETVVRQIMQFLFTWALFLLVLSGTGCSRKDADKEDSHPEEVKTVVVKSSDPNVIEMEHPERFPLVEAERKEVADEINANGVVTPDVNRSVAVLALAGGRVADIKVKMGDDVKKGQLLLQIHSPDLASAFSDYQKARADELLARKQLERSQALYARGAIAEKDLEAAQNAEDKARIDVKTTANRVSVLGGDPDHYSTILDVRAPISGTIVEQNVSGGTGVRSLDATPNLFTIADLSRVWVLCDLYEDVISQVHLGDTASVHLNAYPERPFTGRVSNIGRILDPGTRAAKVRIELANPGLLMRSGMFVTASLHSRKRSERLVLPTSAIVRLRDRNWVFVSLGNNRFRKTEVQTGPPAGDRLQQILAGLQIHDKVAVNALQFANASEVK